MLKSVFANVIGHIANGNPEYQHPYLWKSVKLSVLVLLLFLQTVVLCGGLNTNLFKKAVKRHEGISEKGVEVDLCADW